MDLFLEVWCRIEESRREKNPESSEQKKKHDVGTNPPTSRAGIKVNVQNCARYTKLNKFNLLLSFALNSHPAWWNMWSSFGFEPLPLHSAEQVAISNSCFFSLSPLLVFFSFSPQSFFCLKRQFFSRALSVDANNFPQLLIFFAPIVWVTIWIVQWFCFSLWLRQNFLLYHVCILSLASLESLSVQRRALCLSPLLHVRPVRHVHDQKRLQLGPRQTKALIQRKRKHPLEMWRILINWRRLLRSLLILLIKTEW